MAARSAKTSADKAPAYEPETLYNVTLSQPAQLPWGDWLLPAHGNQLKGKYIVDLGDAVAEAAPVEPVAVDG